ncbi:MAG: NAAT family transporter [Ignavibacteria bacterium]|jgi:multiple antibiotic resistance protein|nr:NAAT family transporter [Ignavibacteria bacterium]
MFEFSHYIKIFIALLALVNPFEALPFFLSGTKNLTKQQKVFVAKKTFISVFIILVFCQYLGKYLLEMFGISTASFSIAGGIIIFLIALNMVIGKSETGGNNVPDKTGNSDFASIAIVPLATPLLAGPGPISSIIVYGSTSTGWIYDIVISVIIFLISFVVFLVLNMASRMEKILTPSRVQIITKISGLFVAAIAIEIIIRAVSGLLKAQ